MPRLGGVRGWSWQVEEGPSWKSGRIEVGLKSIEIENQGGRFSQQSSVFCFFSQSFRLLVLLVSFPYFQIFITVCYFCILLSCCCFYSMLLPLFHFFLYFRNNYLFQGYGLHALRPPLTSLVGTYWACCCHCFFIKLNKSETNQWLVGSE